MKSHMSTVKHSQLTEKRTETINNLSIYDFCRLIDSDPSTEKYPLLTKKQSSNLQETSVSCTFVSTEIKWSLKAIMSHFSLRSCLDLNALKLVII